MKQVIQRFSRQMRKNLSTDAIDTLFVNIEKAAKDGDVNELKKLLMGAVCGYTPDADSAASGSNVVKLPL